MKNIIKLFNDMKKKKIIVDYALGGGIAAKYYVNPPATKDIDFFVIVNDLSISFMGPIYAYMLQHGAKFVGHLFKYNNTIIDIIPAMNELIVEAVKKADIANINNVSVRIVNPDYLAAIALQVERPKDIDRVKRLIFSGKLSDQFFILLNIYRIKMINI
jgi:hypothetical protein